MFCCNVIGRMRNFSYLHYIPSDVKFVFVNRGLPVYSELVRYIHKTFPRYLYGIFVDRYAVQLLMGMDTVYNWFLILKKHLFFQIDYLAELCVYDFPQRRRRFQITYLFLDIAKNFRLNVRVSLSANESLPSCATFFPCSAWLEREIWDLFGVYISGHKDLRKILTDYCFLGHPLRKEFPLTGYYEMYYNENDQQLQTTKGAFQAFFRDFAASGLWGR